MPSVASAIDGLIAVLRLYALQLAGDEIQRFVPAHLDELFCASQLRMAPRPVSKNACADGRLGYAILGIDAIGIRLDHCVRRRIAAEWHGTNETPVLDDGRVNAEM